MQNLFTEKPGSYRKHGDAKTNKIQASVQQISLSYSDNDVNIVLRVRETGLYGWRAECPEKKTTNSRSNGVIIYSRPRVLRNGEKGQPGRFAK
jgi:hypothetical protein